MLEQALTVLSYAIATYVIVCVLLALAIVIVAIRMK